MRIDALQLVDAADEQQHRQLAKHLVDPQADVGRACQDARLGPRLALRRERFERLRRHELGARAGVAKGLVRAQ